MRAVVLVAGRGPYEIDPVLKAELEEFDVEELTAVIRIKAYDGRRKDSQDVLQPRRRASVPCSAGTGSRSS